MNYVLSIILAFVSLTVSAQNERFVGGDISMLPAYEGAGNVYFDRRGKKIDDLVTWLTTECGWNSFRVRLFVNPQKSNQLYQDLDYVKRLGKRIKDAGASFLLDFHYSDSWADPTMQFVPKDWLDLTSPEAKAKRVYDYTRDCLEQLKTAGATPDFVQVGNEISYGIMDVPVHPYDKAGDDWQGFVSILTQGCKAVRDVCPQAKIIIHTERAENTAETTYYYSKLATLDYDIIGLSYYPIWHGTLYMLSKTLTALEQNFPTKHVQIVETAYNYQYWPTEGVKYDTQSVWPCSADGQYQFISDLITMLASHQKVNALYYWFPEEAGNGDKTKVLDSWVNRGLWWPTVGSGGGHWPVTSSGSDVPHLMKSFLTTDASAIIPIIYYKEKKGTIDLDSRHQLYISNGKKHIIRL